MELVSRFQADLFPLPTPQSSSSDSEEIANFPDNVIDGFGAFLFEFVRLLGYYTV
jgi:hypothetical protein